MHAIGVMPMPPAISTECARVSSSGKWQRGALDVDHVADVQRLVGTQPSRRGCSGRA